jgi:hypothetical protein
MENSMERLASRFHGPNLRSPRGILERSRRGGAMVGKNRLGFGCPLLAIYTTAHFSGSTGPGATKILQKINQ